MVCSTSYRKKTINDVTEAKLKNAAQDLKGAHFDEHVDLKVLKHFVGLFG